jgi:CRP/FNR family transcriptional regulator, anaerobic regulatory protein
MEDTGDPGTNLRVPGRNKMNRSAAVSNARKATPLESTAHKPVHSNDNETSQDLTRFVREEASDRSLAINELLFGMGEPKRGLYRVKSGALVIYEPRWNGHRATIEFAFPGDIVGLGFLETHTCSARATIATSVERLPSSAQDRLFVDDPVAQARLADAIEREIDFLRESCVRFSKQNPLGRIAAFLLTLSRENEQEGRDPALLLQPLNYGVVADFLALCIDRLGALLVELERRGLIEPCPPDGLRLVDIAGLEGMAGLRPSCSSDEVKSPRGASVKVSS